MEFSIDSLHQIDAELETVMKLMRGTLNITDIENMKQQMLMKQNKDTLVNFVQSLAGIVNRSQSVLRLAAAKVDELKSDNLKNQSRLISLQKEMIQKKSEQLDSVKNTVQTEMKTWAGVVSKSCSNISTVAPRKIIEAVKSAVGEEDRARNFMVYGAEEETEELDSWDDGQWLKGIFQQIEITPDVAEHYRVGTVKAGSNRPIKVKLRRPDTVMEVLVRAKKLKGNQDFGSIYIAPDRTFEEREAHKQLIDEMKKRRAEEPGMHFYIKRGKVLKGLKTEEQLKN